MLKHIKQYNQYLRNLRNLKSSLIERYKCTEEDLKPLDYFQFEAIYTTLKNEKMKVAFKILSIIEIQCTRKNELLDLLNMSEVVDIS